MAKKKHPRRRADIEGLVDGFTLPELASERVIVLTYNPILDTVEIDDTGCSPLEVRAIVTQAADYLVSVEKD